VLPPELIPRKLYFSFTVSKCVVLPIYVKGFLGPFMWLPFLFAAKFYFSSYSLGLDRSAALARL